MTNDKRKTTNDERRIVHRKSSVARSRKGFTLMETVIYIGLLSFITSFVVVVLYQMIGSENQGRNRTEVDGEGNFMMQKMVWALVGAQAINAPAVSATGTTLSVNKYNYASNPIVFDVNGRNIRIAKGTSTPVILNSARVYINQLTFQHLAASGTIPEGIAITMQVVSSDIERPVLASTTFNDTIYLRQ